MNTFTLQQLFDLGQVQTLLESHYRVSGMACGLMANDASIIVAAGLQDVCTQFHWNSPVAFNSCWRKDPDIIACLHAFEGDIFECRCKNGMVNIAMPIVVEGSRLAVFFAGQFFYDNAPPDPAWFRHRAEELGFDSEAYLEALRQAPLLNRAHVGNTMRFLHQVVQLLAETGHANLKQAHQQKMRQQVERDLFILTAAINNSTDAIFVIDDQLRFRYVNDAACRSLGYSRDELLTTESITISPDISPEMFQGFKRNAYDDTLLKPFETWHQTKDGRLFPVEISATLFEYDGIMFGLATARDITERKRMEENLTASEHKYRTLAESLPDNIVRYDRLGRAVYINPVLEKNLGSIAAQKIGMRVREFHTDGSYESYAQTLDAVLASGKDGELELIVPGTAEEPRVHHIRMIAERGEGAHMTGVLAIGRDITERKRAEAELLDRQQRLFEVTTELSMAEERERRRIAAELHDHIGQDLVLARINLGMLAKSPMTSKQSILLGKTRDILGEMIQRVRSLTHRISPPILENGRLESALKCLGKQLETDIGLAVVFKHDSNERPLTEEIRSVLYFAARELLINVAKHAQTGRAAVTIRCENSCVIITIEDDGVGFDPKSIESTLSKDGSGFGLFNLQRRINHLGGQLELESATGLGTRATIVMPLSEGTS